MLSDSMSSYGLSFLRTWLAATGGPEAGVGSDGREHHTSLHGAPTRRQSSRATSLAGGSAVMSASVVGEESHPSVSSSLWEVGLRVKHFVVRRVPDQQLVVVGSLWGDVQCEAASLPRTAGGESGGCDGRTSPSRNGAAASVCSVEVAANVAAALTHAASMELHRAGGGHSSIAEDSVSCIGSSCGSASSSGVSGSLVGSQADANFSVLREGLCIRRTTSECFAATSPSAGLSSPCRGALVVLFRRWGCCICRMTAASLSAIHPFLRERGIRLVGIGFEEVGLDKFIKARHWSGELYLDAMKQLYKSMGCKTVSWTQLWGLASPDVQRLYQAANQRKFQNNFEGDTSQFGGCFLVDGEGRTLFVQIQTTKAFQIDTLRILDVLGVVPPPEFDPLPNAFRAMW